MVPSWRFAAAALVAAGTGIALVISCSDPYSGELRPDSGATVSLGADADTADPCAHARPPEPPEVDDAPERVLPPIVVAMTETLVDESRGVPGFDLDGVCTCETRPNTARSGSESCVPREPACDYDGGIDNGVAKLLMSFTNIVDFASFPREQLARGRANVLVQITNYNGKANDTDVTVAVYASDGILEPKCPGSEKGVAEGLWTPGFCGDDPWTVRPESVVGNIPSTAGRGYVRDGILVTKIVGEVRVPFSEAMGLAVPNPTLTARLVPLGEDLAPRDPNVEVDGRAARLWALQEGTIAARIPVETLLAAVGAIRLDMPDDASVAPQVCEQPSFGQIRAAVCGAVDITRSAQADFGDGVACDALSAGIPFVAMPAQLGPVYARRPLGGACDPATFSYGCP